MTYFIAFLGGLACGVMLTVLFAALSTNSNRGLGGKI